MSRIKHRLLFPLERSCKRCNKTFYSLDMRKRYCCKKCMEISTKESRINKCREYYRKNSIAKIKAVKKYNQTHKKERALYQKQYYQKNRERILLHQKERRLKNNYKLDFTYQ